AVMRFHDPLRREVLLRAVGLIELAVFVLTTGCASESRLVRPAGNTALAATSAPNSGRGNDVGAALNPPPSLSPPGSSLAAPVEPNPPAPPNYIATGNELSLTNFLNPIQPDYELAVKAPSL